MGSQIFDYWYDPSRFMLEHYIDGDLVNDETPINRTKAGPGNLHVWGMLGLFLSSSLSKPFPFLSFDSLTLRLRGILSARG